MREVTRGGLSFTSALTVMFIGLKLCGMIQWSWVWVLAPTWIDVALAIICILITYKIRKKRGKYARHSKDEEGICDD